MSLQKLQSIVTVFEKNDYNSPSAVVTAVRQLLNIFQIDVTAEEATELIAMMKEKIEVAMGKTKGITITEDLGSIALYKGENGRTQNIDFHIRNNLLSIVRSESLDTEADYKNFEEMCECLDERRISVPQYRPDDIIYGAVA